MYALVSIKFRDARLRKCMLDTQKAPLMECLRSREGFWELQNNRQPGRNMLGEILMQLRQFIGNHSSRNVPGQALRGN